MKKLLSIVLSLVMVMTVFTGCGDKKAENSSFFKEAAKMQDIKTGTADMEFTFNAKGTDISKEKDIPKQLKNGDSIALKLKMETTAESDTKQAVKISAQYGVTEYAEVTTVVIDGAKLYVNVGALTDFIKSVDETAGAQVEAAMGQLGAGKYISLDMKQVCQAMNIEMPDMSKSAVDLQKLVLEVINNLDKSFADIQGKDGDDYTLTVGSDNADKVAADLVKFCEDGSLKEVYTALMDWYVNMFGADTEMGKQFVEMKKDSTKQLDEAVKEVKENKDKIVSTLKDAKLNVVAKLNVTGDEGERVCKLSVDSGEIKGTDKDITGSVSFTSNLKEGKVSIKEMIPTEGVVDITAMVNMMLSQFGAAAGAQGTGLY